MVASLASNRPVDDKGFPAYGHVDEKGAVMADITRYPFVRHLRGTPTTHVRHLRRGSVAHQGVGVSFFFRPLAAVLSEVPVDDRELPLLFHARTEDFQDLAIQATVTYRVSDPVLTGTRLDFAIDPTTGRWRGSPLEQLGGVLTETAQQHALDLVARAPLASVLRNGVAAVRNAVMTGTAADQRLADIGITVVEVRVVALRPEPEMERALQTPTRERVQQDADKATFERRAVAVERERAIGENELTTQIELARREEQLVGQRGANARRTAEEKAAASEIETTSQASRNRQLAEAKADATRLVGAAEGAAETARVDAYRGLDPATLLGLALRELAGNLPAVDTLVLSPDMLTPLLTRLATGNQPAIAAAPAAAAPPTTAPGR
jgi:regulator of protease activity HflC (stomatin/prohibitin superfamily)